MNFYRYPSTERQESVTKKKKRSWASTYKYKRKKKNHKLEYTSFRKTREMT